MLVAAAIERLVDLLDEIEPDDEEPDSDGEPSLGSLTSCGSADQMNWAGGGMDDRERTGFATESDDEEPTLGWGAGIDQSSLGHMASDGDNEPELGWTDAEARTGRHREGWEAIDGEADLGWQNTGSQARLHASPNDCEQQCEDEGAQCEDEGAEHYGREHECQGIAGGGSGIY
jgi:hypothetical protein